MKKAIVLMLAIFSTSICLSQLKPSISPIKDFKGETTEHATIVVNFRWTQEKLNRRFFKLMILRKWLSNSDEEE